MWTRSKNLSILADNFTRGKTPVIMNNFNEKSKERIYNLDLEKILIKQKNVDIFLRKHALKPHNI